MLKKAVFLDRDGVLNHAVIRDGKPFPPSSLAEVTIPHDARAALQKLKSAGFLLIGATNQPDVARKKTTLSEVESINAFISSALTLDDLRVCYHDDCDECDCRKPKPGLMIKAAKDYGISLEKSFMIGDRWKDIEAGFEAGCQTIWLRSDYDEPIPPRAPHFTAMNLMEATEWIVSLQT